MKIGLAEKEIKEKEPRAKKAEKEGQGLIKEFNTKKADVERLSSRIQGSGWDDAKERELLGKQAEHSQRMNELLEVNRTTSVFSQADRPATGHDQIEISSNRFLVF